MSVFKSIDAWANMPCKEMFEGVPEVKRLLIQSKTPMHYVEVGLTPEEVIKLMDEAGVERILLNAWYRPGKAVVSNEMVYEWTRKYPDRFIGIAGVDLSDPVEAVKTLEKCVKEYKFKGLRVVNWLWELPPNHKLYYPLYVKCVELDIPFFTQVGHTGPLKPSETGRPVPYLDEVALTFPKLKIIGGHLGYPWTNEMIGVAWKHENVYIDTSAYAPRYYPPEIIHYMKTYGSKKVMYGTNFAQLGFQATMEQVKELGLPEEVEYDFLRGNILRVLGIEEERPVFEKKNKKQKL